MFFFLHIFHTTSGPCELVAIHAVANTRGAQNKRFQYVVFLFY